MSHRVIKDQKLKKNYQAAAIVIYLLATIPRVKETRMKNNLNKITKSVEDV